MAFIIKPLVTEKMTKITEKQENRYGFIVRPEANKLQIKKEVEGLYNVTVVDVNTARYEDTRLLARSRILLHPCQRSLSFTVNVQLVVEITLVR